MKLKQAVIVVVLDDAEGVQYVDLKSGFFEAFAMSGPFGRFICVHLAPRKLCHARQRDACGPTSHEKLLPTLDDGDGDANWLAVRGR